MQPRQRLSTALTFFGFLYSIPATEQQYQIVRADYSAGSRRTTVTQRLPEGGAQLAANSAWATAASASILRPIRKKSLRIYTLGPSGRNNLVGVQGSSDRRLAVRLPERAAGQTREKRTFTATIQGFGTRLR